MLSWVYLIAMARGMAISGGDCLSMAGEPWSVGYFTAMLVMWIIMMVGMMVPSAIPMVLIYASIVRKHPAAPEAKETMFDANPESAEAAWFSNASK